MQIFKQLLLQLQAAIDFAETAYPPKAWQALH
jgi:hypothetical protein